MIIEWIYQHRRGLGGGFVTGVILYSLVAVISPHQLMLGILLFSIFAASTGLGGAIALSILCLLLAGVVGAALGVAIEMGIHHFCNRVENRQLSTVLLEDIPIEPTQTIVTDFSEIKDIEDFKNWGETVRASLYKKTMAENMDEVKRELESGTKLLVKHYKRLARKYHPDTAPHLSETEKDKKKIAFQTLREVYETIEKHWEFALRGIDAPMYSEELYVDDGMTGLDLLKKYHDLLKEHIELVKKASKEMEDFLNNKEERAKFAKEIVDELIAEYPDTDFWSEEEKNDPSTAVQEEEETVPLNHSIVTLDQ